MLAVRGAVDDLKIEQPRDADDEEDDEDSREDPAASADAVVRVTILEHVSISWRRWQRGSGDQTP
jgi:hypothetical protein